MATMPTANPSISILVVEDDAVTLEFLVASFAKKYPRATLHKAINGRAGLELFTAHRADIVVTDINMPEMGGVQMADKIRAIKPATKFIALTGSGGNPVLQETYKKDFEFDHYIVKPVLFQELFAAIEQCMGEIAQANG